MSNLVIISIGLTVVAGVCGLAFWKGGPAEKLAASFTLGAWLLGVIGQLILGYKVDSTALVALVADGILATALLFISIRYVSLWLGGAMLLQSVSFVLHAWYLTSPPADKNIYIQAVNVLSCLGLFLLLCATLSRWISRVRSENPPIEALAT